jgi:alkylated DNA repair dioxygenase AlkB
MATTGQTDLFQSRGALSVDRTFASARRTMLDAHSWVEVVPGWLSGPEALYHSLVAAVPWKQHHRRLFDQVFLEPRLTAEYRDYRRAPHSMLIEAVGALTRHYGVVYDGLWLNLYRNGQDSTGWHRDHFSCRLPECVVPVLSLGGARRFLIKPRDGGRSISFVPRSGDLIVMGGRCQSDWVHGVPKTPGMLEGRISVNFQSAAQARRAAPLTARQ